MDTQISSHCVSLCFLVKCFGKRDTGGGRTMSLVVSSLLAFQILLDSIVQSISFIILKTALLRRRAVTCPAVYMDMTLLLLSACLTIKKALISALVRTGCTIVH